MLRESNRAGGSAEHVKKDLGTLRENMDGGLLANNDIRAALLAGATATEK